MVVTSGVTSLNQRFMTADAEVLRQIFTDIHSESCPHTYNFHMHTVCSDGKLTPAHLMEQVIEIGLRGFAITDHHNVKGFYQAKAWLEDWRWRHPTPLGQRRCDRFGGQIPRLFTGVEITAILADTEVHILGYGFAPDHGAIVPYLQGYAPRGDLKLAKAVIEGIQGAGGVAVLAHPARYRQPAETLILSAVELGIDGVEAYYAYANPSDWSPCPRHTPVVQALAQHHQLLMTCGTDTHGPSLLRRL
ncbi:MAG: PHP domain-containing protein [Nodosilinea sp.]